MALPAADHITKLIPVCTLGLSEPASLSVSDLVLLTITARIAHQDLGHATQIDASALAIIESRAWRLEQESLGTG